MRTNKQLRADAWAALKRQWKPLLGVAVLSALFSGVLNFIAEVVAGDDEALLEGLKVLFAILAYPLCTMGMRRANLIAWSEEKLRVSAMFRYCFPVKRWACAMLPGFLAQVVMFLAQVVLGAATALYLDDPQERVIALYLFLAVIILGVSLWLSVRLLLFDYAFIAAETPNVFLLVRNAWNATARQTGAVIRLLVWFLLPLLIGIIPAWLAALMDLSLLSLATYAILIPVGGYFRMVLAGFAMDRMPELKRIVKAYRPAKEKAHPDGEVS